MKKSLFLVVTIFIIQPIFSQYKNDRLLLNPRNYEKKESDPYNPTLNGIASFIIPGLGQMSAGETERGISQFLCYGASILMIQVALNNFDEETETFSSKGSETIGKVGLAGFIVTSIGSAIDAVRVSKVKNMAYQEKYQNVSLRFTPTTIRYKNHSITATGIRLSIQLD